jgi:hypothetical protein
MRATTMNLVPRTRSASDSGFFAAESGSEQVSVLILDALRPLHSHQTMSHHVQIGERAGDEQPIRVFRNTAIAHLGEAKDALDDADGVLDPGTHARARPIDHALTRLQVFVAAPALLLSAEALHLRQANRGLVQRFDWREAPLAIPLDAWRTRSGTQSSPEPDRGLEGPASGAYGGRCLAAGVHRRPRWGATFPYNDVRPTRRWEALHRRYAANGQYRGASLCF